ncbi:DUF2730 family protein [Chromohalobacter israelensis]|uniref:DUF2730 family protein n=1 Tax=Chromohalobacter israelensis TaxID=141390 RepID=UPI00265C032E|nr:DUF2730 family protein [Chromohalobacter salexigens]MDO0944643.1 DUF2730 family protein [Chromohalobacter salexigens]
MESINWDAAKVFSDLGQWLIMGAFAIYAWWSRRNSDNGKTLNGINNRIDGLDKHLAQVEQTIKHRPRHDDLDKLRTEMTHTNRELAEVSSQLKSTTALLNRLHDYLLQERGNR